jgi:hypothetical protein
MGVVNGDAELVSRRSSSRKVHEDDLPAGPRLRALAGELVRLQPSRTDPESYFVTKDRIVTELRRLSRQVDGISHFRLSLFAAGHPGP